MIPVIITSMLRKTIPVGLFAVLFFVLAAAACARTVPSETPEPAFYTPTKTFIPSSPTPTPEPAAVLVNGEAVLLVDYESELARLQAADQKLNKTTTLDDQKNQVLDAMIERTLLAQAALDGGFKLDETELDARISRLAEGLGGKEALTAWQNENGYSVQSFRRALTQSITAAWQRDKILAAVPKTVEQVHAVQIFVVDPEEAANIKSRLDSGAEFATLVEEYDPLTKGDLGWFPRGYLYQPEVEEAAFKLEPGQVSAVVKSDIGYHIIMVTERDPQRQLNSDAYLAVQRQALSTWLKMQRSESQIEILIK